MLSVFVEIVRLYGFGELFLGSLEIEQVWDLNDERKFTGGKIRQEIRPYNLEGHCLEFGQIFAGLLRGFRKLAFDRLLSCGSLVHYAGFTSVLTP